MLNPTSPQPPAPSAAHLFIYWECHSIHELILQEDDGVRVPDGCLQQTTSIFTVVWRQHLSRTAQQVVQWKAQYCRICVPEFVITCMCA